MVRRLRVSTKYYQYYGHQNKGDVFVRALQEHGWEQTSDLHHARFILTDIDVNMRSERVEKMHDLGGKTFVYPHAARPDLLPDMPGYEESPFTTAHFVVNEHHAEVMRLYGYSHPTPSVGWYFTDLKPFEKKRRCRHVLFAPIHCSPNGWLSGIDRTINEQTYDILLKLACANKIQLTVRYLYSLPMTGLPTPSPKVTYIKGSPNLSMREALAADVVVAHQTYAYNAVALGVPTVMMGEQHTPRLVLADGRHTEVKSWDKYEHLLMFPYDILATDDPLGLLDEAVQSDEKIAGWRERLIGTKPFDKAEFVKTLESYL